MYENVELGIFDFFNSSRIWRIYYLSDNSRIILIKIKYQNWFIALKHV